MFRSARVKSCKILAMVFLLLPGLAHAWWNKDWKQRTQFTLNTSSGGEEAKDTVSDLAVPLRLHSGNFDFLAARPDGSDLRVVAGDDKTPLAFHVERYDRSNELAIVWVRVPSVLPGTDKNLVYVYSGNENAPAQADEAVETFDSSTIAAFHFGEPDGAAADQTGTIKTASPVAIESNGLIGPSARFAGTALTWPASDKLKFGAAGPLTVSFWIRPDVLQGVLYAQGTLQLTLDNSGLSARLGALTVKGVAIAPSTWSHVALTLDAGNLALYVDGARTGQGSVPADSDAAIGGDIRLGDGYQGLIDEVQIASAARSAEWIKLAFASQSADARLIASKTETPDTVETAEDSQSYLGILIRNLTPDGWAVIGVLFLMFWLAVWVMIGKALLVRRVEGANEVFLQSFRDAQDVLSLKGKTGSRKKVAEDYPDSPIYRLYRAGLRELLKRDVGSTDKRLSGASLDAVKASIDAQAVRENNRLNSKMVLLTIAIAGGPFLGLLGTVVGVMITFAAIAAAGDVNVNAIAPGIAAALLATVAGLAVAIPSLFGYNYLASRIRIISSEMQIFVDEFVTRVAEVHGAP